VVVSGYAKASEPTDTVDRIVNATIDPDKQHLHGGYIRSLPTDETFDYDLQSLGGTSGSPVYYIEAGATPRTHMVGVHVAGHSATTNLGCRITPAKLAWIRQQAAAWSQPLTFSLGARASSGDGAGDESAYDEAEQYGHVPEPVDDASAEALSLRPRALTAEAPDYPGASRFVAAHPRNFRAGRRRGAVIDRIVIHITAGGPRIDGTIHWFQDGERRDPATGRQAGPSSAHYIVGRDGEIVQMVRNADTAYHASSANGRSIGIEHNANKPYRLNRRDLPPTMEQYQASAHLVAWLAAQYGIPLDRTHIVGHVEATPGDGHDCPSSYWDWDAYMQCVQLAADALAQNSSTGQVPATSQALRGRAPVQALEIITPFYDPSSPSSALTCQNDAFSLAREEWFVGVEDTRAFPHAAICLLEMKDASGAVASRGTGFYIGANRILTCAHNLHGAHSVDIVPGNNGRGVEPFGRCNATSSQWRIAPGYIPGHYDRDLAVIENVAIAAPNGAWFAFLNATPGDRMPLVVCGYSSRSEAVPELTAAIDGFKQHLHGGYAQRMHTPETIDYPILTLKRASGSPVYTLRDDGNGVQALICAVHVSGVRAETHGLNTGCFITPQKIDWIEGRTTSFGAQAARANVPVRAQELITPYYDPSSPGSALQCTNDAFSQQREEWYVGVDDTSAFPHSAICYLRMTTPDGRAYTGTGFYIGRDRILTCAHNLRGRDTVQIVPGRNGAGTAPFGEVTLDASHWRLAPRYAGPGDYDNDLAVIENVPLHAPNGAYFRFLHGTPAGTMPLAVCGYSAGSHLHPELGAVADRNKQHLHGGHAQGQATPDTIDYDILAIAGASGSPVYTVRDEGNGLEAFVCAVHVTRGDLVAGTGGTNVNRGCFITPAKLDWIEGRATSFGHRTSRALSTDAVEHRVTLIPQPDKNACWAASMAMLKSFRSDASFDPEGFVREAGGTLAGSYGWEQLEQVRAHYRFEAIDRPSNASLYHTPAQWAQWLRDFGPLWVVIVGAPHAVVVSGIRGDLAHPASTEVYVLNPWDTTTAFDSDPVAFNPPNRGFEGWMPFESFAADFGEMAEPDYGNWRVLHLPASAARALSLGSGYRLAPPPRSTGLSAAVAEPIEPTRVPGTRMSVVRGSSGASRWALDQLEGRKVPASLAPSPGSAQPTSVVIELGEWPALAGEAAPLPLTVRFSSGADGSVGDVAIVAGTPTSPGYGVEVVARIDDAPDADGVAAVRVGIDVRFTGLAQGAPCARIDLRLLGNGRYERSNRWVDTSLAA
jgi:V8-like Glu-specific endopeptidase